MSESFFRLILERVQAMKPGETITVAADLLEPPAVSPIADFLTAMSGGFAQADRVLENVIGSARTHRYRRQGTLSGTFIVYERFHIDLPDGIRGYVSPDRRDRFETRPDGLYCRYGFVPSPSDEGHILCALRGHDMRDAVRHPPIDVRYVPHERVERFDSIVELIPCKKCIRCDFTAD